MCRRTLIFAVALAALAPQMPAFAQSTAFTYQGTLRDNGAPANGSYDFQFDLYADAVATTPISLTPVTVEDVNVQAGLFTLPVDFGFGQFADISRVFLEVRTRPGASSGAFTTLSPRQEINPAPTAMRAFDISDGIVNASKISPSSVQVRVNGQCPPGSAIIAIGQTGTVTCDTAGGGSVSGFGMTTVDSTGNVGQDLAMVVAADGLPSIAYYDATNGDLKYVHCLNAACSLTTRQLLDTVGIVGLAPSIANGLDQNRFSGAINISYYDQSNSALKLVRCASAACSSTDVHTIDATGVVGTESSVDLNINGYTSIAYRDSTNSQLALATCGTTGCSFPATLEVVDNAGNVGTHPIHLLLSDLSRVFIYADAATNTIKYARCVQFPTCTSSTVSSIAAGTLRGSPLAAMIGANGYPVIAATDVNDVIHVITCNSTICTNFTDNQLGQGPAGALAIARTDDGVPSIAYYYTTNQDVRYLRCRNVTCAGGTGGNEPKNLDTAGDVGSAIALVIPPDNKPLLAYYDATNGDLRVLKCPNLYCAPYFGAK